MSETKSAKGGRFLIQDAGPDDIFAPEDFSSEQLMYAKTAREFMEKEVMPLNDEIEAKKEGVMTSLLAKAGEIGLLMADVPEAYGGLELDKASSALVAENISRQGSFSCALIAHVGIGTLPIVYYGNDETKEKYLPPLADGSKIGCYCLTEPAAGSDSLSGRSKAILSEDGSHYVLNGTKQFITNGGIADYFIVFAKVDGEHFTGFVLERGMEGLSHGPEEHKMGIAGTSTTTILLEDVKVPVANVLGEIGKGHKIAFNILNIGRFKLGVCCVGAAKMVLNQALEYALERKQFGVPIASFGLIKEKPANMYARIYAGEAFSYRTIGLIDSLLAAGGGGLESIEEFSVECSIVKVGGSEMLDFVVDEAVQIHGGYGYCDEYPAARAYRDSRINRIFEGTNEINRLLIPGMLLRKAMKGELPLMQAAAKLQEELMDIPSFDLDEDDSPLVAEGKVVEGLKKLCLFVAGSAAQKYGMGLDKEQEILSRAADLAILAYTAESVRVRALKEMDKRGEKAALQVAAAQIICEESMVKAEGLAREAICAMSEGDAMTTMLAAMRRLSRRTSPNLMELRRMIADKMIEDERTPFPIV